MHDLTSYLIDLVWFHLATETDELRRWRDWFSFTSYLNPSFSAVFILVEKQGELGLTAVFTERHKLQYLNVEFEPSAESQEQFYTKNFYLAAFFRDICNTWTILHFLGFKGLHSSKTAYPLLHNDFTTVFSCPTSES